MKRFNANEFIWFFILLMFTMYIYFLLSTGKIILYIHPKMVKYSAFSFAVLGELTVVQFFNIFTGETRAKFRNGYALFLLALVVGILLAPGGLNSDIADKRGVTLVSSSNIENISAHSHSGSQVIEGNEIVFNENNYIHYLEDLGSNLNKHTGKKIKIAGFVLKKDNEKKDEFVVSRMLINCCAADSQVLGITVKYDKANTLKDDDWIKIEGVVTSKGNHAVIEVNKLQKIEKPNIPYIYE